MKTQLGILLLTSLLFINSGCIPQEGDVRSEPVTTTDGIDNSNDYEWVPFDTDYDNNAQYDFQPSNNVDEPTQPNTEVAGTSQEVGNDLNVCNLQPIICSQINVINWRNPININVQGSEETSDQSGESASSSTTAEQDRDHEEVYSVSDLQITDAFMVKFHSFNKYNDESFSYTINLYTYQNIFLYRMPTLKVQSCTPSLCQDIGQLTCPEGVNVHGQIRPCRFTDVNGHETIEEFTEILDNDYRYQLKFENVYTQLVPNQGTLDSTKKYVEDLIEEGKVYFRVSIDGENWARNDDYNIAF